MLKGTRSRIHGLAFWSDVGSEARKSTSRWIRLLTSGWMIWQHQRYHLQMSGQASDR